jgi:hypothetical protein
MSSELKLFLIILGLLAYQMFQIECNVCKKDQTSNNCTSTNSKYIKLNRYNDFTLDGSFLLNSFDSNNNLKCLASCTTNDQCSFSIFKQNRCYICNENIANFWRFKSGENCLIYQKTKYLFLF